MRIGALAATDPVRPSRDPQVYAFLIRSDEEEDEEEGFDKGEMDMVDIAVEEEEEEEEESFLASQKVAVLSDVAANFVGSKDDQSASARHSFTLTVT
jgi:hypothetical protein